MTYEKGFEDKCAEHGIDPKELVKEAERLNLLSADGLQKEAFGGGLGRYLRRIYAKGVGGLGRALGGGADDAAEGWAKSLTGYGDDLYKSLTGSPARTAADVAETMQRPGFLQTVANSPNPNFAEDYARRALAGGAGSTPLGAADVWTGRAALGLPAIGGLSMLGRSQGTQRGAAPMGQPQMSDQELMAYIQQQYPGIV